MGKAAAKRRTRLPSGQVAYDGKRLIGRDYGHPLTQLEAQNLPYKVLEYPVGSNRTHISLTTPDDATEGKTEGARTWLPEELSALVRRHLKDVAESSLGLQKLLGFSFTTATVSVPAEFDMVRLLQVYCKWCEASIDASTNVAL